MLGVSWWEGRLREGKRSMKVGWGRGERLGWNRPVSEYSSSLEYLLGIGVAVQAEGDSLFPENRQCMLAGT